METCLRFTNVRDLSSTKRAQAVNHFFFLLFVCVYIWTCFFFLSFGISLTLVSNSCCFLFVCFLLWFLLLFCFCFSSSSVKLFFYPPKSVLDPYPALVQLSQVVLDGAGPTSSALIHLSVLLWCCTAPRPASPPPHPHPTPTLLRVSYSCLSSPGKRDRVSCIGFCLSIMYVALDPLNVP